MNVFEYENVSSIKGNKDDFIDITQELLDGIDNELEGCKMVCSEDFDFEETMTSIELMHPKMDIRLIRGKANSG